MVQPVLKSSWRSRLLTLTVFTTLPMWSGCELDLRDPPPEEELIGTWSIDPDKTMGEVTRENVRTGRYDLKGFLRLYEDGHFEIENFPKFWDHSRWWVSPRRSGSGKWEIGRTSSGTAVIDLGFKRPDSDSEEAGSGYAYFRRKGQDYLLRVVIGDPDEGESLVLKRRPEKDKSK